MARVVCTLAVLFLLASTSCRSVRGAPPGASATDDDRRDAWTALIRHAYVGDATKLVVLDPQLGDLGSHDMFGGRPDSVPTDAWRAFRRALRRPGTLPRDLDPGLPLAWFTEAGWRTLPDTGIVEGRWSAFHARFPNSSGYIQLSPIGFSRDGQTAVLMGMRGYGSLSMSADIFVLKKTAEGWHVVETRNVAMA